MKADASVFQNIVEQLIPFNKMLGMELVEIKPDFAKIKIPFKEDYIGNPLARALHGGLIATAMDTVGGAAGMTTLVSFEDKLSTIDMRVDYLRPGQAKDLFVEGKVTRSGNRILVTRMIAYQDDPEVWIAEGHGVYNVKRKTDNK